MNCSQCEDLFAAHVEGLLGEAAEYQLEAHLDGCVDCRMLLDETRRLLDRLDEEGRRAPAPSITPGVMDRIIHQQALRLRRDGLMRQIARISVAAAVLVGLSIVLLQAMPRPLGGRAYAADLSAAQTQVEGAKTATWQVSYYQRFVGAGGVGSRWLRCKNEEHRYAYKAPGLYRRENLGEDGEVTSVSIEDVANRAKLEINHKTKTATLTYLVESSYHPRGPFVKYLEPMQRGDLQSLGKEDVAGRPANGFRCGLYNRATSSNHNLDFWLDAATKRLVLCQDPGRDLFDTSEVVRDTTWDPNSVNTIEYRGTTFTTARDGGEVDVGHIIREIAFDVELDESLFELEPPEGYAFKTVESPSITEQDVIEFMGIVADYFDKTFPDRMPNFIEGSSEELERFRRAQQAVLTRRGASPAEIKLVEAMHSRWQTGIPGPGPMQIFITQQIAKRSWKYLGKGVKLGDRDRMICWYRPRDSRSYHVVYGDLSVKDVAPEDLPLPVRR
jgi:outer membrane lipoprotein-sorting protein